MSKTKRILKSAREKWFVAYKVILIRLIVGFFTTNSAVQSEWDDIFRMLKKRKKKKKHLSSVNTIPGKIVLQKGKIDKDFHIQIETEVIHHY